MRDSLMDMAAEVPPPIVESEPRYQQETTHSRLPAMREIEPEPRKLAMWHLDGVAWHHAEPPRRGHTHWAQTVGCLDIFRIMYRCPCGAMCDDDRTWVLLDKARVTGLPIVPAARPSLSAGWLRIVLILVVAIVLVVAVSLLWTWLFGPDVSAVLSLVSGVAIGCAALLVGTKNR